MKSAKLVLAVAISTLGFSSLSYAEADHFRDAPRAEYRVGPPVNVQPVYGNRGYDNRANNINRGYDNRRVDNRGYDPRGYNRNDGRYVSRAPQYYRGAYVPAEYRGRQYQVNDWRERRLQAPQPGQQWVQNGTNLALIAIATGLIAQIVLN
jgi:Ni/Co efflux regulator RcnB